MKVSLIINILIITVIIIIFLIFLFYSLDIFFYKTSSVKTTFSTTSNTTSYSYTPKIFNYIDESGLKTLRRGIIPTTNTTIPNNYLLYF